ncbi:MAG TPA: response regulator [Candidatus Sulfotelmatobacter sp.]|nr:response regulator [Candidatus Sulfotelmatobacter sp.]
MPHRILVVDDEQPILFAIREYFSRFGYQVDCAGERQKAEALMARVLYDVVILDLRLNGIDSMEGLDLVRYAQERSPRIRVCLLTAYGNPVVEQEARRLGVQAFLQKPMPLPEILRVVTNLLSTPS